MRKLLIGFLIVLAISAVFYFRWHRSKALSETAYVGGREITIWNTSAQVRSPVASARFGERLEVVNRYADQVQVRTGSGIVGWVGDQDLLSAEFWQKAKDLEVAAQAMPIQARGHTRVLSNMHLEPGRDTPRIRQINKNAAVELFERRPLEVPSATLTKTGDQESGTASNAEVRKQDWWLVRAHLPDQTEMTGWILGRFIDLDVPAPLPDYASAAGMRMVGWFELNYVSDESGQTKPQYLVVGTRGAEGQACDFTLLRVFTWGSRRQRYETAFVESDLCGKLPVRLTPAATPGGDASFAFQDRSGGAPEQRLYRMHQTIVRRMRDEGAPSARPVSKKRR